MDELRRVERSSDVVGMRKELLRAGGPSDLKLESEDTEPHFWLISVLSLLASSSSESLICAQSDSG